MAYASATQRQFQSDHAAALTAPRLAQTAHALPGSGPVHTVSQRSVDRSWAALTSPVRTGGRTPTEYSKVVQQEYAQNTETKRLSELATSTASIRKQTARARATANTQQYQQQERGGRAGIPGRSTRRPAGASPERQKTVRPVRSLPGGPQSGNYEPRGAYGNLPNPAVDPPITHAELLRTFPWSHKPEHHMHDIDVPNRTQAGYYRTHWDDRFATNPYTTHTVEVINTARPQMTDMATNGISSAAAATAGGNHGDSEAAFTTTTGELSSPAASPFSATALGFGRRHENYKQYVHKQPPSNLTLEPTGPIARSAHQQQRIVMEVSPHLLEHLPPQDLHTTARDSSLALAVPFNLARFVPRDTRDGQGKGGHLNASGLGYGRGHRNHARYLYPNVEGDPQLAYFRSNHCT